MLLSNERLTKSNDINRVLSRGKKIHTPFFVLIYDNFSQDASVYAFVAGKKVGNAIKRNRAKRILREAVRTLEHKLPAGFRFVFVARKASSESTMPIVKNSIESIRSRIK
ncbi:ribonuclease P protein component [candidate division WWE3 bacterium CG_4_9_14_3_um_filter_41_6]|uniref:Ribonuclease P protein component n=1 Tax=candidate division WWE3 bacterium CG_4_10_14_0_2_um_filter_41_14 TaxID=1975072 RepID=A0A2M7TM41_UNCKA|nr:MAG: ribonuclease P protein component [candidate division WWE3 bacterium CG_4_10_14_0_2_um_filter_41_14]PJA38534.1 MAG: ribonuclease P protein component [candidate division WWE3 bacterium CG_4_9_14_3_um_filter_41_6]